MLRTVLGVRSWRSLGGSSHRHGDDRSQWLPCLLDGVFCQSHSVGAKTGTINLNHYDFGLRFCKLLNKMHYIWRWVNYVSAWAIHPIYHLPRWPEWVIKIRCFFVVKFKLSIFMTLINFEIEIRVIHGEKLCDNTMKDSCLTVLLQWYFLIFAFWILESKNPKSSLDCFDLNKRNFFILSSIQ